MRSSWRLPVALLWFALASVSHSSGTAVGADPDETGSRPQCVPTGFATLAVWEDSISALESQSIRTYREIPPATLFHAFVEQTRALKLFRIVEQQPNDPYDLVLTFRLERLQRRAIGSPDDLWMEAFLSLRSWRTRQALWADRFGIRAEARELGPIGNLRYRLLARLAARKFAEAAGNELNRYLNNGGLGKLSTAALSNCPAQTVVQLDLVGLPLEDESAILRAVSGSPCFALERDPDRMISAGEVPILILEATAEADDVIRLVIRDPRVSFEIYRMTWPPGDEKRRDAVLRDVLAELTAYHHKSGPCVHARSPAEGGPPG